MNVKFFVALLTGGLAYIIIVLKGLILRLPLSVVFNKGLIGFIILTLGGWLITYFLENLGTENGNSSNNNYQDNSHNNEDKAAEKNQQEDEFSPLNPTVLEVDESGEEIGND